MTTTHPGQWRLERVELVNWGTFHGHHVLDVAREGFLLTGHSGSGKSSLVDAITSVLTPRGKTRFNAAAADGASRRDDRTVLSYVRGAWRRAANEDTGEIATQYLRPGATWSGILLRYSDGTNRPDGTAHTATLVKLFHVRRGAQTAADVRDLSLLISAPVSLLDFEELAANGLDVRGVKRSWPDAGVYQDHARFAAKFARTLGISGDRAILLLHKTQSAKNLGSLDELFRTFMLDEPSTFGTADRAVEQFTDLSHAHNAVVQARQQIDHLRPLAAHCQEYDDAADTAVQAAQLGEALDGFTLGWKRGLTRAAAAEAREALARTSDAARSAREATEQGELRVREAQALVDARGGARLEAVEAQLRAAEEALAFTREARARFERDLLAAGIAAPATFDELADLRRTGAELVAGASAAEARAAARVDELHRERARIDARRADITGELQALRKGRSNIGRALLNARALILRETGLPSAALPFAAELLQVRAEHRDWTGAIERVVRPLATLLLVPAAHEALVSAAVDGAHLGAHLRFEVVPAVVPSPRRPTSPESLVYRVEVADHPMQAWLNSELVRRFDYLCVERPRDLHPIERGVTRAGQVKRGRRSYEKDDRFAVDDPSRWVLGFDNAAKVDFYLDQLRGVTADLDRTSAELVACDRERQAHGARLRVLGDVRGLEWHTVDVGARERQVEEIRRARADLLAADGDLRQSQHLLAAATQAAADLRTQQRERDEAAADAGALVRQLDTRVRELEAAAIAEVAPELAERLREEFFAVRLSRQVTHDSIDADSRKVAQALSRREQDAVQRRAGAEVAIAACTGEFARRWPALASDLTPGIEDRAGFLAILDTLRADRLPDFEQRFFDMLRDQSQQNIGLLAQEIRRAPSAIRHRVAPINESLRRSQFAPGRFLQIQVEEARPAVAAEFLRDLNTIASGSLAPDEDRHDAEERFTVLARVMRRLGSSEHADRTWRTQCLDTGRHVRFVGREVDEDGVVVDVYDSGDGRSGGQKQKLVVFCLAAALRYQLAREADLVPTYATVVMDEAFDKADAAFTRMALDIFREFGFHMVLATPLKLLQTLEDYVGGIALVTCTESRSSRLAPVAFEALTAEPDLGGAVRQEVLELELDLS